MLITHDMGVVADIADRVCVMYAGRVVEDGPKRELFANAQHPYTWGLLGSIPRIDRPKPRRLTAIPGLPPSLLSLPAGLLVRAALPARLPGLLRAAGARGARRARPPRPLLPAGAGEASRGARPRSTRSSRRERRAAAHGARA